MDIKRGHAWLITSLVLGAAIVAGLIAMLVAPEHAQTLPLPGKTFLQTLKILHEDQCEWPNGLGAFVEPENSWSNLGYLAAGVLIVLRARSLPGILFGAHLIPLAFLSADYHATVHMLVGSETPVAQILDVAFIYAALFAAIFYGLYSMARLGNARLPGWVWWLILPPVMFACDGLALAMRTSLGLDSTLVFIVQAGVLAGLLIACTFIAVARGRLAAAFGSARAFWAQLGASVAVFAVACFLRLNDGYAGSDDAPVPKLLCFAKGAVQAHALWHLLGALALTMMYDLFAQFQRGGEAGREPGRRDQPVLLDQFTRLWTGYRWIFTSAALVGAALFLVGTVGHDPVWPAVILGLLFFIIGFLFLFISFIKSG